MPCTTTKKRCEENYCGRLVLDAGIEYLARPTPPPPPPRHSALTRFMQRIFGKDCKQLQKRENHKRACEKRKKSCRDRNKGKWDKSMRHQMEVNCCEGSSYSASTFDEGKDDCCQEKVKGLQKDKKSVVPNCQQLVYKEQYDGQHKLRETPHVEKLYNNGRVSKPATARGRYKYDSEGHDPFRFSDAALDVAFLPELCSSTTLTSSNTCKGSCKAPPTRRRGLGAKTLPGYCVTDTIPLGTTCTGTTSEQTSGRLDTSLESLMLADRGLTSEGAIVSCDDHLLQCINGDLVELEEEGPKLSESSPLVINETYKMEGKDIINLETLILQDSAPNRTITEEC